MIEKFKCNTGINFCPLKINSIRMKYIYKLLTFLLLAPLFGGCDEDKLALNAPFPSEEEFFISENNFQSAVFGIYQKLNGFYVFNGNDPIHRFWLLPDDNLTLQENNAFNNFREINPTDDEISTYYDISYQLINRANTVLSKIEERGDVYTNQEIRNAHQGEALFLRGLMFFRLWNFFGTAPLVTEPITSVEAASAMTNSQENELLAAAIEDLSNAASLLPLEWPDSQRGRATAGAAYGMLGKVLTFRGIIAGSNEDLAGAINAFDMVQGYSLMEDYGANFDENFENNQESLFEVQFSLAPAGSNNVWLSVDDFTGEGDLGGFYGFFDNNFALFGKQRLLATTGLDATFEAGDPRIAESYEPGTGHILKYVNRGDASGGNPDSFNNARILRYADVLLLKALAITASGGVLSEAIDLINEVRTRAREFGEVGNTVPANYETNESDRSVVQDWIFKERRMELAFEESHRWFDMRLLFLTGQLQLTGYDFGDPDNPASQNPDFASHEIVYPFPDSEVEVTALRQNSGY